MSEYFSKPKSLGENVKVELDISNYATKADLKYAAGVDTSDFVENLLLKSNVDKLDIDKLKDLLNNLSNLKNKLNVNKLISVPVDLSKRSDVVKMMLLKKMYIMLRS